jgi:hypothetical protein
MIPLRVRPSSMPLIFHSRLIALLLTIPVLASCADASRKTVATPGSSAAARSTENAPLPYMRVTRSESDTVSLEIALRRFVSTNGSGPTIWLAGASHLGESNYFAALQMFLDAQPLVLFEGVGAGSKKFRHESPDDGGIQNTLAGSLSLAFQLNAIDYDRPNFRNSDLTLAKLEQLFAGESAAKQERAGATSAGANEEFNELLGIMDGSSMLGALLHAGVKFLGSTPRLRAMTRLMLIETLGELKSDLSQMKGAPPELQKLLAVIIQERNKVVIDDLRTQITAAAPPASIAVFYGAGHMADFEKRLVDDLHYCPAGEVWLRAIAVNPRGAGLADSEVATMRSFIQWQMQLLTGDEE